MAMRVLGEPGSPNAKLRVWIVVVIGWPKSLADAAFGGSCCATTSATELPQSIWKLSPAPRHSYPHASGIPLGKRDHAPPVGAPNCQPPFAVVLKTAMRS